MWKVVTKAVKYLFWSKAYNKNNKTWHEKKRLKYL